MWSPESVELIDVVIHFENIMDVDPKFAHLFPKKELNFDLQNESNENHTCDDAEEPVIINEIHRVTLPSNNISNNQEFSVISQISQSPILNGVSNPGLSKELTQSPLFHSVVDERLTNEVPHSSLLHSVNEEGLTNEISQSPLLHRATNEMFTNEVPRSPLSQSAIDERHINEISQSPLLNSICSEKYVNEVPQLNSPSNCMEVININDPISSNKGSSTVTPSVSSASSVHNFNTAHIDDENCKISKNSTVSMEDVVVVYDNADHTESSHLLSPNESFKALAFGSSIGKGDVRNSPINESCVGEEEIQVVGQKNDVNTYYNDNQILLLKECQKESPNNIFQESDEEMSEEPPNDTFQESEKVISKESPGDILQESGKTMSEEFQIDMFPESEKVMSKESPGDMSQESGKARPVGLPSDIFKNSEIEVLVSNTLEKWLEACQNTAEYGHKDSNLVNDCIMYDDDDARDNFSITSKNTCNEVEYDLSNTPYQITGSWKEFNSRSKNNFTRGCKWAPDGSCILTCSDDNMLRIFNLPSQLWDSSQWCDISEMEAALKIPEGDLIYDYSWYPLMNSNDAVSCCLASTSRKSTVHLWDGFTGELRCSYRPYNHLDEVVTPHSLSFDADGQKIFCGFKNIVRIFNVNIPGRSFESRHVFAKKSGQSGIISCFAFTPANRNISVAGSYQKTIGIYSEPSGELECVLEGQKNGITQLQFSPDGNYLYSGGRKDPDILCWDLRNLGTVLFSLKRSCQTNQRMYFDISRCGKYVVTGNGNGIITFWDVTKKPEIINDDDYAVIKPLQFFFGHNDCVNGASLHPTFPLLCSSSGQRKFPVLLDDDEEEKAMFSSKLQQCDNSLRLWWIGNRV